MMLNKTANLAVAVMLLIAATILVDFLLVP